MAAIRFLSLESLCSSTKFMKCSSYVDVRAAFTCIYRNYNTLSSGCTSNHVKSDFELLGWKIAVENPYTRTNSIRKFSPVMSSLRTTRKSFLVGLSPMMIYRSYASSVGSQGNDARDPEVLTASSVSCSNGNASGSSGSDSVDKLKDGWQYVVDGVMFTREKVNEAYNQVTPYVQQLLDSHPYLRDVIVPVGGTLFGTLLAWFVLPKILRKLHKYSTEGPASLLSSSPLWGPVPYEKSFWGALEDPVRYLITFMALSEIGMMVAPSTIPLQYIAPAWKAAAVLSFVWFLQRWKTNVISRALAVRSIEGLERDKLLTLEKFSSVGLFSIGLMALAEASGVAVQSILTVGGIGGVATAFAARDVLGNVLSGLSVQISRPFSVGDTIKAGSIEGQVVEVGLTTTLLLSSEKFPLTVPNSLFSSQVIVNKSRALYHAMDSRIPCQLGEFDKIPQISEDIKTMIRSHPNVFLEKEAPYCFLSRIERSYAELTVGCNLKIMSKDELFSAKQDILLQSAKIIKEHGAVLGSAVEDITG